MIMGELGSMTGLALEEDIPAGIRVLVIDDDRVTLNVIGMRLKKYGYKVTQCLSGKEALEILRRKEGEFDIVLTDVRMPDVDGFELLEKIGLGMDLPVVMMSADTSSETALKAINHGACDYLKKPVPVNQLKRIGEHVLIWRDANSSLDPDLEEN